MTSKSKLNSSSPKNIRPTMILIVIGTWLASNSYFIERYVHFINAQIGELQKLVAVGVVLWIVLISFYAFFHIWSFLFSAAVRKYGDELPRNYQNTPPVAILYPCMNDMQERSIAACLSQNYPDYRVYILDDSTTPDECERVTAFTKTHSETVSVIRRDKKNGFKAGNLNNALKIIGDRYKYVCIIDADELIPPTFLRSMVAIAEGNEELAFVQASHRMYGGTEYGRRTGDAIDVHWNYFLPARNSFGFVYFYGHGALLRVKPLVAVGGFPEITSEDVAFATKLRKAGYRGYFAHSIGSFEETPPSYAAFRRRNKKIIHGTLEFLTKFYPSFFRSTNVSIVEKIDLLISSSVIYLPIPFICLIFLLSFLVPVFSFKSLLFSGFTGDPKTYMVFMPLQAWDFNLFLFFTVFAPVCYLIPSALRSPSKALLYMLRMGAIHLSVCLHSFASTFNWVIARPASFVPTGDRSKKSTNPLKGYIELSIGVGLTLIGVVTVSLFLVAIGLSLILVPILNRVDLSDRLSSILVVLPMLIAVLAALGTPILLTGVLATVALAQP